MHKELESYLEQVKAQLKPLPAEKQDEELQEVHHHLQALVASRIEHGDSEDEAVAAAIRQFGNAKQVGRSLRQAWNGRPEKPFRVALAGACVLVSNAVLFYLGLMAWVFSDIYILKNTVWRGPDVPPNSLHPLAQGALNGWVFFATPFIAGWIGGLLAPKRAVLVISPVYLAIGLSAWRQFPEAGMHQLILFWMPLACLGALTRAWLTRRRSIRTPHH